MTSALRVIMRTSKTWQNIECNFDGVARSTVLFKPNVANIVLFNFCEQKFVQHGPITIAIDCNGLSLLIFEEKLSKYGPKSSPKSKSFQVRRLFIVFLRVFYAPNVTILLRQDQNDFHLKRRFFCSRSQAHQQSENAWSLGFNS